METKTEEVEKKKSIGKRTNQRKEKKEKKERNSMKRKE
jgi:hypothetical protein